MKPFDRQSIVYCNCTYIEILQCGNASLGASWCLQRWHHPQFLPKDDEYVASLAADREKDLKANEEAEARRLKEKEVVEAAASQEKLCLEEELKQKQEAEELERQLALKKESLPLEPTADEQGALTLVVRLPDGSRRGRRFHRSNKLQVMEGLCNFVQLSTTLLMTEVCCTKGMFNAVSSGRERQSYEDQFFLS